MTERSIVHGSFTVERRYKAAPEKVFRAWADPALKRQWFGAPEEGNPKHLFDFRVGGRERSEGEMGPQQTYIYDAVYYDNVENNRIVYAYEMYLNGERISVSVATNELTADGDGTRLVLTEHGAFLDGLDTMEQRREGTEWLMDKLGTWLDEQA